MNKETLKINNARIPVEVIKTIINENKESRSGWELQINIDKNGRYEISGKDESMGSCQCGDRYVTLNPHLDEKKIVTVTHANYNVNPAIKPKRSIWNKLYEITQGY